MKKLFISLFCIPLLAFSQNEVKLNNYFKDLTTQEKRIIVNKGTERAYVGVYNKHFEHGIYICKACNNPLYKSDAKFESNCGWPAFDDEIKGSILRYPDYSYGMNRVEICCANCNGHLGHIFEGEQLTEKNIRHCVNSISIKFIKKYN